MHKLSSLLQKMKKSINSFGCDKIELVSNPSQLSAIQSTVSEELGVKIEHIARTFDGERCLAQGAAMYAASQA